jgi:hypothetical protein
MAGAVTPCYHHRRLIPAPILTDDTPVPSFPEIGRDRSSPGRIICAPAAAATKVWGGSVLNTQPPE